MLNAYRIPPSQRGYIKRKSFYVRMTEIISVVIFLQKTLYLLVLFILRTICSTKPWFLEQCE